MPLNKELANGEPGTVNSEPGTRNSEPATRTEPGTKAKLLVVDDERSMRFAERSTSTPVMSGILMSEIKRSNRPRSS